MHHTKETKWSCLKEVNLWELPKYIFSTDYMIVVIMTILSQKKWLLLLDKSKHNVSSHHTYIEDSHIVLTDIVLQVRDTLRRSHLFH